MILQITMSFLPRDFAWAFMPTQSFSVTSFTAVPIFSIFVLKYQFHIDILALHLLMDRLDELPK